MMGSAQGTMTKARAEPGMIQQWDGEALEVWYDRHAGWYIRRRNTQYGTNTQHLGNHSDQVLGALLTHKRGTRCTS